MVSCLSVFKLSVYAFHSLSHPALSPPVLPVPDRHSGRPPSSLHPWVAPCPVAWWWSSGPGCALELPSSPADSGYHWGPQSHEWTAKKQKDRGVERKHNSLQRWKNNKFFWEASVCCPMSCAVLPGKWNKDKCLILTLHNRVAITRLEIMMNLADSFTQQSSWGLRVP